MNFCILCILLEQLSACYLSIMSYQQPIGSMMTDRHLRRRAVEDLTGLSRSTIYDLMSKNAFPRPVKLTGKAVAWPESKISDWLAQRGAA